MKILKLCLLMICMLPYMAKADAVSHVISYECNKSHDLIELNYKDIIEGSPLPAYMSKHAWDVVTLIKMKEDPNGNDSIAELKTISQTCRLSDGVYSVKFGPITGGSDHWTGPCGACITGWVEIYRGKKLIYPKTNFVDFFDNKPSISKIILGPKLMPPVIKYDPTSTDESISQHN